MSKSIFYVPDTQVKSGVETNHILAAGNYIVEHQPDIVVVAGDWWDMPSLNRFGSNLELEGLRILEDIQAGKDAMDLFMRPLLSYNKKQRKNAKKMYKPRLVFTTGNHDPSVRIPRYIESHPVLSGMIKDDTNVFLRSYGFEVYDFLDIVNIEGIRFSHYFVNPHSMKKMPLGGTIDTMLKNCGYSFVQGHTQTYKVGKHYLTDGSCRLGIVAGAFYQHDEAYMGVQGNLHWRGCVQLNEVQDGAADVCELSIGYLLKEYL